MRSDASEQRVLFGAFALDFSRGLLLRGAEPVAVRPKPFALISYLARNANRLIGKDELISAVWPNTIVTEDSLTQTVKELRRIMGEDQHLLTTIARRGYLLKTLPEAIAITDERPGEAIAVLPFSAGGDSLETPALAEGFAEDILIGLSRFTAIRVIPRAVSWSTGRATADERSAAEKLGARFIVSGSLRRSEARVAINVTLWDAEKEAVLWGDSLTSEGAAIFDAQALIVRRIVNHVRLKLDESRLAQARRRPSESLDAYEFLLRGIVRLRGYEPGDNDAAMELFRKALERDQDYGLAHSYLGLAEIVAAGYAAAPADVIQAALERVRHGVGLAEDEPRCHRICGIIAIFARKHSAAEHHMRRALALNPFDPDNLAQFGYTLAMRGKAEEGLRLIDQAISENALHPAWYHFDRGAALYSLARYEEAVTTLEALPRSPRGDALLAASLAQAGQLAAAHALVAQIEVEGAAFHIVAEANMGLAFEHHSDTAHFRDGLLAAVGATSAV